jgi:ApaG protein
METQTTNGIKISVETFYQPKYSKPVEMQYIFAYRIRIENLTDQPVQLLRRYWRVVESTGQVREIEGEGVIGQQPLLAPGERHEYVSWVHLATGIGTMEGSYLMQHHPHGEHFRVRVPRFPLQATPVLN